MKRLLFPLLLVAACKQTVPNDSSIKTDLGPQGNAYVKNRFEAYARKTQNRCTAPSNATGKRVVVTGFGPFGGSASHPSERNRSGSIVRSMANDAFWPGEVTLATMGMPTTRPDAGRMPGHDGVRVTETDAHKGGYAAVRALTIDGERYQVCFLLLDVVWDLASAIIVTEARSFGAEAVLMMGTNGGELTAGTFEMGAINRVMAYESFDADGRNLLIAKPLREDDPILPPASLNGLSAREFAVRNMGNGTGGTRQYQYVDSNWDAATLGRTLSPLLSGARVNEEAFTVEGASMIHSENHYICNNVTFVTLNGLAGRALTLAGGELMMPAARAIAAKAGFLHVPGGINVDEATHVGAWSKVVAGAIKQLTTR